MRNEKRDGYYKTEVGWIPTEWGCDRLLEHTLKIGSGVTPTGGEAVYESQGIPFIRSQNILIGEFTKKGLAYIPSYVHDEMQNSKVIPGDVLYNITGASIGRCCLFPQDLKEANVNQHVCIIRPTRELTADFLMQVLNSSLGERQLYQSQAGGGRQGLNYKNLGAFYMPFPSFDEQQKIAQILSTWDRAIERVQRLIEAKQRQKKGLMQGLLTGKLRFPEFGEQSCNKAIPNDWKLYKLSQVAEIINGGTPSRNIPEYWGGNIPWIAVGDFSEVDRFISDTKEKITELGFRESSTNLLKTDELIISARGTVGAVAQLTKPMAFNQTSYGLRAYTKLTLNDFLFYLLRQFNHKITDISHGAIFDTITRDTFDYIELPLPNLHEQRKIADVLGKMDDQIDLLKKYLEKLKQQKKGLMQKLLTGEIRVK